MGLTDDIRMDAEFGLSVEEIARLRGVPVELPKLILKGKPSDIPVLVSPSGVDYSFCPENLLNDYSVRELISIGKDFNSGRSSWRFNSKGLEVFNRFLNSYLGWTKN